MLFVPHGAIQTPNMSENDVGMALVAAERKGREVLARRYVRTADSFTTRDALIADYATGLREHLKLPESGHLALVGRDAARAIQRLQPMADAVWHPSADAASTVPEALTFIAGAPIAPLIRPNRLIDQFPTFALPVWTDTVRFDYLDWQGQVQWGRGGDTSFARSGYTLDSKYAVTPEIVWTSTDIDYKQQMQATSPNYAVDPMAQNANAAMMTLDLALENAVVTTPAGLGFQSLANTPCLRSLSLLTYGSDNTEDCVEDLTVFLQSIGELSLGIFAPDTLVWTQRIHNRLIKKITTSAGFPINYAQIVRDLLSEHGISKIIVAPSLQDFGGTNVDAMIAMSTSGPGGLKRYSSLAPTAVRTSQAGLSTQTIYASMYGGLYAQYRASSYIRYVPVSALS